MKSLILSLFAMFSACTTLHPTSTSDMAASSVRLITASGRGGGTGSVLSSSKDKSVIITNKHVCEYVGVGGTAETTTGRYKIETTKASKVHDLCLVTVAADLGVNTEVAPEAPVQGDKVSVSGHPKLLPHTRMDGYMSKKMQIEVLVGFEPCTPEDMENDNAMYCIFMGGKPVLQTYEAQLTSALISPGNSGSAVYDSNGKIVGLIFAGGGELSMGFMVPWEYVKDFVEFESKALPSRLDPPTAKASKHSGSTEKIFFNPIYIEDNKTSFTEQLKNIIFKNFITNPKGAKCFKDSLQQ